MNSFLQDSGHLFTTNVTTYRDNFNDCNNVILTDGYTDHLDFSRVKGKTLIISVGTKCPLAYDNGRVKQIVLDANTK